MLSNLLLKRKWAVFTVLLVLTFIVSATILMGGHFLVYGQLASLKMPVALSTILISFIGTYSHRLAGEKQQMLDLIADLNNKLSPMFFIPQLALDFDGRITPEEKAVLINKTAETCKTSMPEAVEIIRQLNDSIDKL